MPLIVGRFEMRTNKLEYRCNNWYLFNLIFNDASFPICSLNKGQATLSIKLNCIFIVISLTMFGSSSDIQRFHDLSTHF